MHKPKAIFRSGFIAVLIFSIVLCSFSTGMVRQEAVGTPFSTLPPVNATLATPIGALTPVPTPIPTLGPGQYFEEGDDLPAIIRQDLLDELFGYSEIVGKPGLYLVWSTNEEGEKHYYILDEDNEYFTKIRDIVENYNRYKLEYDATSPWLRYIGFSFLTGFFADIGVLCFAGAIISGFSGVGLPAAGALTACGGVAGTISFASGKELLDASSDINEFELITETVHLEIEGYFVQIPYSIKP